MICPLLLLDVKFLIVILISILVWIKTKTFPNDIANFKSIGEVIVFVSLVT